MTPNLSSEGIGASAHIFAEMMNHIARLKVVHVPYKGGAPALTGVLVGEGRLRNDGGFDRARAGRHRETRALGDWSNRSRRHSQSALQLRLQIK
jgi:hypothetical protein